MAIRHTPYTTASLSCCTTLLVAMFMCSMYVFNVSCFHVLVGLCIYQRRVCRAKNEEKRKRIQRSAKTKSKDQSKNKNLTSMINFQFLVFRVVLRSSTSGLHET